MKITSKILKKIAVVVAGAFFYGFFNKIFSQILFPGADVISLRPQLVIPITISLLLGPVYGGTAILLGNVFGDLWIGFGFSFWHWSLANFLIGFIPGIVRWFKIKSINTVKDFALVILFVFLGNAIGLSMGYIIHVLLIGQGSALITVNTFLFPALISNLYISLLILPTLLWIIGYLKLNMETRVMFFLLLFNMVIITFLTIVFISIASQELHDFAHFGIFLASSLRWIGLAMLLVVMLGVFIGYYYSQRFVRPLSKLVKAARKIEQGSWQKDDNVNYGKANMEVLNLIKTFNRMASQVKARENKMKKVIKDLQFAIDKETEDKKFEEITESDFFKKIEQKSKEIRSKKKE